MGNLYGERDYVFGQAMLKLRTEIGMTQAGLADKLCISRRAVGEWEAGNSYPKAEHLKQVIALAIQQEVFPAGREVEEIRALWRVAHQKLSLDERWLSVLLSQRRFPQNQALWTHVELAYRGIGSSAMTGQTQAGRDERPADPRLAPPPLRFPVRGGVGRGSAQGTIPTVEETMSDASIVYYPEPGPRAPVASPQVDWGEALAVSTFYGREQELALLFQWVVQERASVVGVLGMGGIGKSTLAVSCMYQLAAGIEPCADPVFRACPFEVIIFRSLRSAPSCDALLDECLQVFSSQSLGQSYAGLPEPAGQAQDTVSTERSAGQFQYSLTTERRISLLLEHLRKTRTLLVLDGLECLLTEGDVRGHFRPGFEGYGQLLRRVAETGHQSCVLVTSREKPGELGSLSGKHSAVRCLRLTGLGVAAGTQLLVEKGLVGTDAEKARLVEAYSGNPLVLKMVAETIADLFSGEIGAFFVEDIGTFGSVASLLDEHFARLSALEKTVLGFLAIVGGPVTLDELLAMLVCPLPRVQVLEAIDAGYRRCLIEPGCRPGSFTLPAVVREYVTTVLVTEAGSEIEQGRLDTLIEYGLQLAYCKEEVRQTQERRLLFPLLTVLQSAYRRQDALEERLLGLLEELRGKADFAQGYGPANLLALLRLLRGHLNGLDLSQLSIRGAYREGIKMQDTNLSHSLLREQ